jgi:hypothetical protein
MASTRRTREARGSEEARKRQEYWRGILAEQRQSGLTHTEFCRRKSISTNSYFWYKRELPRRDGKRVAARATPKREKPRRAAKAPSLVPVTIRARRAPGEPEVAERFEVELRRGRVLRVPPGFRGEDLRRLLAILEEEAC